MHCCNAFCCASPPFYNRVRAKATRCGFTGAYNISRLSELADSIFIMGYDMTWKSAHPGAGKYEGGPNSPWWAPGGQQCHPMGCPAIVPHPRAASVRETIHVRRRRAAATGQLLVCREECKSEIGGHTRCCRIKCFVHQRL